MRYIYIYIFFILHGNFFSQVRFNINEPISIDTTQDPGIKVIETRKHQFVSCGVSTWSLNNYFAAYLVKTDSSGNLMWKKQYDIEIGYNDYFQDLLELPDSNYLICGITGNSTLDLDEAFLVKIDTGGNILWLKKYPYAGSNEQPRSMKLTPDGKVIIVGTTFTTGNRDGLLIKTDVDGNLIWRKTITNTPTYDEVYYNVDVIKNNQEYIISGMKGYYSSGNSYFDLSLLRTDTAGNVLWQKEYGYPTIDETGHGGTPTLDSGYVLCGTYNDSAAVLKIDKQGVLQWFKHYSSEQNSSIYQIIQLQDSSFAMITSDLDWTNTNRTGYLIKADKNGNKLWKRIYPHPPTTPNIANYFFGFSTTHDKGFIITGQYNHIGQPYQNMWLVKTDSMGCDSMGGCSYLPTKVGEQSYLSEVVRVYPNPATQILIIECEFLNENTELKIINNIGEVLYVSKAVNKMLSVDLSAFSNGIYFIKIADKEGKTIVKKFVVQK